jgi:tetratricopeptide (TPR) repeat protein
VAVSRRLEDLLARCREMTRRGESFDPAVLCRDCPDLLPGLILRLVAEGKAPSAQPPTGTDEGPTEGMPTPGADASPCPCFGRFQAREEIGRGGMGVVYRAFDPVLGRDVAVKALLAAPGARPDLERRFLTEARVGARLQHPGLAPVYDLGQGDDGRPYLVMKLVRGRTLADLLAERPAAATVAVGGGGVVTHAADPVLARFLGVFEQVCQAVGYAHAQGVIHRDLKPANVMLGAFGEVQVMDWGLARLLSAPGDGGATPGDAAGLSQQGTVIGTPAYMAPELARGEIDLHDARADVFGLGAILCELLTGQPAFPGPRYRALARAMEADLSDAFARLDGAGVDAGLAALARACLCPEREGRPADGAAVAACVAAHRASVAERLRRAELERAVAEDLAAAEAAHQEQRWDDAWALLQRAEGRLEHGGADDALRGRVRQARAGLERTRKDRDMTSRLDEALFQSAAAGEEGFDDEGSLRLYEAAFAWYVEPLRLPAATTEELRALVAASAIRERLLVALDHWAELSRRCRRPDTARLLTLAQLSDPDPFRRELREAVRRGDWQGTRWLVDAWGVDEMPPARLVFVADALRAAGGWEWTEEALRRSLVRHPDDFLLNFTLARACYRGGAERAAEAVRYFTAVLAHCPGSAAVHVNVGVALRGLGRLDEAADHFREAARLKPGYARAHHQLGLTLREAGRPREAADQFREAVFLRPTYAEAHLNLGLCLAELGDLRTAVPAFREAARLEPYSFAPLFELGKALAQVGLHPEAEEACREALLLRPDSGPAWLALAQTLQGQQKHAEAVDAFREAFRLGPTDAGPADRLRAAASAALAGCGRDRSRDLAPRRLRQLRRQALRWLAEDLLAWAARLARGAQDTPGLLRSTVGAWQADPQLDCVRHPDALAELPEGERPVWRQFWHEVAELLRRAEPPPSPSLDAPPPDA